MIRQGQSHIVKSGSYCKQTPDLMIWRQSNLNNIGIWSTAPLQWDAVVLAKIPSVEQVWIFSGTAHSQGRYVGNGRVAHYINMIMIRNVIEA